MKRTYSELILLPTFEERFEYLRLDGKVGSATFGFDRYLNQILYGSYDWKQFRRDMFVRDMGLDLGAEGHPIFKGMRPMLHHLNPISAEDITNRRQCVFDPENVITTIFKTHQAIHYGDASLFPKDYIPRRPNDTCPWK